MSWRSTDERLSESLERYRSAKRKRQMHEAFAECDVLIPSEKTLRTEEPTALPRTTRVDISNRAKARRARYNDRDNLTTKLVSSLVAKLMNGDEDGEAGTVIDHQPHYVCGKYEGGDSLREKFREQFATRPKRESTEWPEPDIKELLRRQR